jgi:hypothetical protein
VPRRFACALTVVLLSTAAAHAGWQDDVGYTDLAARLGAATPDATGIDVTQVEATDAEGDYYPDDTLSEFAGKTLTALSGPTGVSGHATNVAYIYYGLTLSISPGIDPIDVYQAGDWLQTGFLRTDSSFLPLTETRRIQNHSWIAAGGEAFDTDALRRVDYMLAGDGVVAAVGVNNGATSAMPTLLSSAYNAITVGLTTGNSSHGPTTIDVAGRVKPDIVGPASAGPFAATSWATPVLAGSAALLVDTAETDNVLPTLPAADRRTAIALLAKTLLMAGATKDEFTDWRKGLGTESTDGTVPLDYRFGAGEVNIDHSHAILEAAQQPASDTVDVAPTGWDVNTAGPATPQTYFFEVPTYRRIDTLSILAAWNRLVTIGGGNPRVLTATLADINLHLYRATGTTLGPLEDLSISALDNVEHIWLTDRPGGRYAFTITTDQTWDYAVAWRAILAPFVAPDFDTDNDVDLTDYGTFLACYNGPNNPPAAPGCDVADFDADGDVDLTDYGTFLACYNGPNNPPACN